MAVVARIVALDVGDRRIGVAVSDPLGLTAQPVEVYTRVGYGPDSKYVQALCERYDTKKVLLGLPLNMDSSLGAQARKAMDFGNVLKEAGLQVYYQDERMTTVTAESVLISGNVRRSERKLYVDKLAACVILQQWLDSGGGDERKEESNG